MAVNRENKWPKAVVAVFGILGVCTAAYFMHNANVLWALLLVYWIATEI
jgi:hypothetical protein